MTTMAADDFAYIRARLDVINAEKTSRYYGVQKFTYSPTMTVAQFLMPIVEAGLDKYGLLHEGDQNITPDRVESRNHIVAEYLSWLDAETSNHLKHHADATLMTSIGNNVSVLFARMRLKGLI